MSATAKSVAYDTSFAELWTVYPRHVGKAYAYQCWCKLKPSEELARLMIRSVKMCMAVEWKGRPMDKIPHLSTWINQKRWEDHMQEIEEDDEKEQHPKLAANEHWCRFCLESHPWVCPDNHCTAPDEMPCPAFLRRLH